MTRLLIHVEGQTEETFVNTVLAPHFFALGFTHVGARLLGNARNRSQRGGIRDWNIVKGDIEKHLKGDQSAYATMMVDYYALPTTWPGRLQPSGASLDQKLERLSTAILADFQATTGIVGRFIPFVLMHEFEALLFSDCATFANSIGFGQTVHALQAVRDAFDDPEHINDSPATAPSKRVQAIIRGYDKVLFGNVAATEIGLDRIRTECPRFASWIAQVESLVS
jgi:hypothetical protein